jgi:predicted ATPase
MVFNENVGRGLYLDDIVIHGFRGVNAVNLESLALVNLLVGKNDSGKTSILEAIAVFAAPLDMVEWANIARSREVRSFGFGADTLSSIDSIRWMFPHISGPVAEFEEHQPIAISAMGRLPLRDLMAKCTRLRGIPPEQDRNRTFFGDRRRQGKEDDLIEDEGWLVSVEFTGLPSEPTPSTRGAVEFPLWSSLGLRYLPRARGRRSNVVLLAPYAHRNQALNLSLLTSSILDETKSSIGELLNHLDNNIMDIEIITTQDGKRPAIAVRQRRSGVVPISVLGDGIRRALSIALSLRKARNGILLIDEIEAALHVSALDRLYPWLMEACRTYNVQLVGTTHSLETIDAIARLSAGGETRDIAAYHLSERPTEGTVRRYTGGMLRRLVHDQGLDVR